MYIALKPCKFRGESFLIGDSIPDGYVLPEAAPRLIRNGMIAEVPGGPLLPPESSLEAESAAAEAAAAAAEGETAAHKYTEDELKKLKKNELADIAVALGFDRNSITDEVTKAMLIDVILEAQE